MRPSAPDLPAGGPNTRLNQWTYAFRATFVLFIVWASASTAISARDQPLHAGHSSLLLMALASVEIIGALLFHRSMRTSAPEESH